MSSQPERSYIARLFGTGLVAGLLGLIVVAVAPIHDAAVSSAIGAGSTLAGLIVGGWWGTR